MLQLQSASKYILIISAIIMLFSCKDIPRDNVLDPKNPDSYRAQLISLEAFVNTENSEMYNEYMLSAIKTISNRYPGKLIYLQYHRNTKTFDDSLAIPENEILYEQYINRFDALKGVPDVFINGSVDRIKGASSVENAINRLDNAIQPLLIDNTHFTIEPSLNRSNSKISISTKIARLGSESISDIIVRVIIAEKIDADLYTRVVRHLETSNLIPRLQPGEIKEIKFSDITIDSDNDLMAVFTVMSNQNLVVYQSVEVLIP